MLVKHDKDIYSVIQAGPWQGLAKAAIEEVPSPAHRWTGPKRPLALHRQVTAFFEWSYAETKSEAVAHWMFHEERGVWAVIVLPQKGRGMAVDVQKDHANYAPTFARLGPGWEPMGTDHNHCSGGAFQSGHDRQDEVGAEGLHVTVGDLGKPRYSIHARASFRQTILPVRLSDWYELPAELQGFPEDLKDQIVLHYLQTPAPAGTTFPEWWKENVIKEQVHHYKGHWDGNGGRVLSGCVNQAVTPSKAYQSYEFDTKMLRTDIKELTEEYQITPERMVEWLLSLKGNSSLTTLIETLSCGNWTIEDALEVAVEIVNDAEQSKTLDEMVQQGLVMLD